MGIILLATIATCSCQPQANRSQPTPGYPPGCVALLMRTPSIALEPQTAPAKVGVSYCFQIYTHCGINFAVDIDGAFWETVPHRWAGDSPKTMPEMNAALWRGTMTLLDHYRAHFSNASGSLDFQRSAKTRLSGFCA
jgi:hypothetical protein